MNIQTAILPPHAEMVRAMLERDTAYEGVFFTAVKTTGIFCRPSCTARKPKPENVEFLPTPMSACLRVIAPVCAANRWTLRPLPRSGCSAC
jgi:methylphosphotriester-DNA--protein-cysteine methyltransferase